MFDMSHRNAHFSDSIMRIQTCAMLLMRRIFIYMALFGKINKTLIEKFLLSLSLFISFTDSIQWRHVFFGFSTIISGSWLFIRLMLYLSLTRFLSFFCTLKNRNNNNNIQINVCIHLCISLVMGDDFHKYIYGNNCTEYRMNMEMKRVYFKIAPTRNWVVRKSLEIHQTHSIFLKSTF